MVILNIKLYYMKKCFKCGIKKELTEFYKHPKMPDGTVNKCKICNKKDVKKNAQKNRKYYLKYDKDRIRNNFNYIFIHRYSGMKQRTEGRTKRKYTCLGKKIMTKEEFIDWCYEKNNFDKFIKLHNKWRKEKYIRIYAPSIDRVDNNKGYTIDNIRWITQQQNSKKYNK